MYFCEHSVSFPLQVVTHLFCKLVFSWYGPTASHNFTFEMLMFVLRASVQVRGGHVLPGPTAVYLYVSIEGESSVLSQTSVRLYASVHLYACDMYDVQLEVQVHFRVRSCMFVFVWVWVWVWVWV
jgi:hypothetical protein